MRVPPSAIAPQLPQAQPQPVSQTELAMAAAMLSAEGELFTPDQILSLLPKAEKKASTPVRTYNKPSAPLDFTQHIRKDK